MVTLNRPSSFRLGSFAVLAVALASAPALAQAQTREVDVGGTRYVETTREVPRTILRTEWDEQQQTVYHERYDTQWHTNYRTYMTPITEYRQELYLANRWNPFGAPFWTYRYVPVTRWEARQEPYQVPIAQRTMVPHQQTVRIPRTVAQTVTDQYITRVALDPATSRSSTDPFAPATNVANKPLSSERK
jgi:hypothetical protein